jgi:hypothetical protein
MASKLQGHCRCVTVRNKCLRNDSSPEKFHFAFLEKKVMQLGTMYPDLSRQLTNKKIQRRNFNSVNLNAI